MSGLVFELIPKIMADVGAVEKKGYNPNGRYKYRSIDDVYAALQGPLQKHGVFFVPQVVEQIETERISKNGSAMIHVRMKVKYVVYATDGSSFETVVFGEAMDSGDKAFNKALTAAFKYMLIQVFCIPVEGIDDADAESPEVVSSKKAAPPPQKFAPGNDSENDPLESIGNYVCPIGRNFKGQRLRDIDPVQLKSFAAWLKADSIKQGKELKNGAKELVEHAEVWLSEGGDK